MNILQYTYTSNKGIMGLLLLIDNYVMIVPVLYWFFFYCSVNIVKLCLHLNINNPLRQQLNLCTDSHQALCSLLRRDASINFKAKGNSLVSVLACNLLMAAYEEDENWPKIFVKVRKHFVLFVLFPSTFDALWIMICVYL